MINPKSIKNLKPNKKGRPKGSGGKTWAELIHEYGETPAPPEFVTLLGKGATWKQVVIAAAYRQAAGGNASIFKELMQRDEPQDFGVRVSGALEVFDHAAVDRLLKT